MHDGRRELVRLVRHVAVELKALKDPAGFVGTVVRTLTRPVVLPTHRRGLHQSPRARGHDELQALWHVRRSNHHVELGEEVALQLPRLEPLAQRLDPVAQSPATLVRAGHRDATQPQTASRTAQRRQPTLLHPAHQLGRRLPLAPLRLSAL